MYNKLPMSILVRFFCSFLLIFLVFEMTTLNSQKRAAIILSGCGPMDGSEIRESIYALTVFEELGFQVSFFAPNRAQTSVFDHQTGQQIAENEIF